MEMSSLPGTDRCFAKMFSAIECRDVARSTQTKKEVSQSKKKKKKKHPMAMNVKERSKSARCVRPDAVDASRRRLESGSSSRSSTAKARTQLTTPSSSSSSSTSSAAVEALCSFDAIEASQRARQIRAVFRKCIDRMRIAAIANRMMTVRPEELELYEAILAVNLREKVQAYEKTMREIREIPDLIEIIRTHPECSSNPLTEDGEGKQSPTEEEKKESTGKKLKMVWDLETTFIKELSTLQQFSLDTSDLAKAIEANAQTLTLADQLEKLFLTQKSEKRRELNKLEKHAETLKTLCKEQLEEKRSLLQDDLDERAEVSGKRIAELKSEQDILLARLDAQRQQQKREEDDLIRTKQVHLQILSI
ncbi:unnamed protein product [Notodromas monacha]|uniref:Uncharacterized protein n=1 Tax=Notodromas monacha TaxID=399045 RepID=A0A7R9BJB5_9CRUS|nr:unnamed protein product [Notodromas monacha]CAG0915689.1 unnamed protein product [Notodromas monacha]